MGKRKGESQKPSNDSHDKETLFEELGILDLFLAGRSINVAWSSDLFNNFLVLIQSIIRPQLAACYPQLLGCRAVGGVLCRYSCHFGGEMFYTVSEKESSFLGGWFSRAFSKNKVFLVISSLFLSMGFC